MKAKTLPNGMSCQASKAKSVRLEVTKGVRFRQDCLTDFRSNKRQLQSVAENICGKPNVTQRDPPGAAAPSVLGESLRWSKLQSLNTELKPSTLDRTSLQKKNFRIGSLQNHTKYKLTNYWNNHFYYFYLPLFIEDPVQSCIHLTISFPSQPRRTAADDLFTTALQCRDRAVVEMTALRRTKVETNEGALY